MFQCGFVIKRAEYFKRQRASYISIAPAKIARPVLPNMTPLADMVELI